MEPAQDRLTSASPGGTAGDEPRALDTGTLRRLCLDLLGRPPLAAERARWLGQDRAALLRQVLASEEFWRNWLEEQLYYFLLIDNFRPATEGVQTIPGLLAARSLSVREALHRISLSSSFDQRNPGPDTFVTVVMEQLLGLTVQKATRELEVGKRIYDGSKGTFLGRPGGSQADVVHIAIADPRAVSHLLVREHERLLRRTPTTQDLSAWASALDKDELCFDAILLAWFSGDAYERRLEKRISIPNRLFVRALFVDLFDRLPDAEEVRRIRSALDGLADSVPLRSLVARLVLDSGKAPIPARTEIADPGAWIRGLFERLLGRSPSASELAAFLGAFSDPACRSETVLYAIVSHPEYQTW